MLTRGQFRRPRYFGPTNKRQDRIWRRDPIWRLLLPHHPDANRLHRIIGPLLSRAFALLSPSQNRPAPARPMTAARSCRGGADCCAAAAAGRACSDACRGSSIGEGGLCRCNNAGKSNSGKDRTKHLISPVRADQAGKFDGPNLGRRLCYLYETLHTSIGGGVSEERHRCQDNFTADGLKDRRIARRSAIDVGCRKRPLNCARPRKLIAGTT